MTDVRSPGSQSGTHHAKPCPEQNSGPHEAGNTGSATTVGGGSIASPVVAGPTKGRAPRNTPPKV